MPPRRFALGLFATVLSAALVGLPGCERPRNANRYTVLTGTVVARHADTGELSVRVRARGTDVPAVHCVVTKDSELYVNDRFSTIEDIQVGDTVELVGYYDPNPRLARFVVSYAHVDHPLPAPSPPDLTLPKEARPSQPNEE